MGDPTECSTDDGITLVATTGKKLQINPSWKNPTGKWRVGSKALFELYPGGLVSRMKEKRKVCTRKLGTCSTNFYKLLRQKQSVANTKTILKCQDIRTPNQGVH
jgi:hypothetical protein